MPLTTRRLY